MKRMVARSICGMISDVGIGRGKSVKTGSNIVAIGTRSRKVQLSGRSKNLPSLVTMKSINMKPSNTASRIGIHKLIAPLAPKYQFSERGKKS